MKIKGVARQTQGSFFGADSHASFGLAAMARAEVPPSARRDFTIYADEFQNFATDSFASLLSEARKYRLALVLVTQYLSQISPAVLDAVFGNVGSLLSFRVGQADAELLARQFDREFPTDEFTSLENFRSSSEGNMGVFDEMRESIKALKYNLTHPLDKYYIERYFDVGTFDFEDTTIFGNRCTYSLCFGVETVDLEQCRAYEMKDASRYCALYADWINSDYFRPTFNKLGFFFYYDVLKPAIDGTMTLYPRLMLGRVVKKAGRHSIEIDPTPSLYRDLLPAVVDQKPVLYGCRLFQLYLRVAWKPALPVLEKNLAMLEPAEIRKLVNDPNLAEHRETLAIAMLAEEAKIRGQLDEQEHENDAFKVTMRRLEKTEQAVLTWQVKRLRPAQRAYGFRYQTGLPHVAGEEVHDNPRHCIVNSTGNGGQLDVPVKPGTSAYFAFYLEWEESRKEGLLWNERVLNETRRDGLLTFRVYMPERADSVTALDRRTEEARAKQRFEEAAAPRGPKENPIKAALQEVFAREGAAGLFTAAAVIKKQKREAMIPALRAAGVSSDEVERLCEASDDSIDEIVERIRVGYS